MGDYGPEVRVSPAQVAGGISSLPADAQDEISVLVTGFGPFGTNLVNASFLIASSLPTSLTFPGATATASSPRRISIHVHPSPIPVAYSTVRTTVPAIIENFKEAHGGRRPDLIIHMGIASTRAYYSVETQAHRDSYLIADINGQSGYDDGERLWREQGRPFRLKPGPAAAFSSLSLSSSQRPVAVPEATGQPGAHAYMPDAHFLEQWKSFSPLEADIRISEDAGRFLCEFIFYTSLSQAWADGEDRNIIFFHVPRSCQDQDIKLGREITIGLIKTLVTCWIDEHK
ncbi:hypothetical protein ASPZODRAFT_590114 [Penicilliopsis zonata CBS 506.65]|uniref:Peptidase C15, pyroglutamyl peptidase I-like protein n=1 Tax=Penicilliopsis zonata CBS 506.65 TaxID=1073090 RepID=A0A1L9SE13_9EURO|nr:hypothetical protein ASPZODRAFT_590114 [Penicilliopsis zonata CBS 506.65]OJJ45419.1 hypothetical protein ASPZODRAFT_590114 [Penicilliopsis zonata CBS 506.65]